MSYGNRKWITREEIAEIHDSIADKIAREIADEGELAPGSDRDWKWEHYVDHKDSARTIREIEKVGRR